MSEEQKPEAQSEAKLTGLDLLRSPFPDRLISKLPKPTKTQTDEVKNDYKKGIRCAVCSAWHHPDVVHLDYVGHAALTSRLLDSDPKWTWEPLATVDGLPAFDADGGLWIKLTVCGHTRLGYGNAEKSQYKEIGSRQKEVIGDALRNAAMRFGAALDLWHKGDLHGPDEVAAEKKPATQVGATPTSKNVKEPAKAATKAVFKEQAKPPVKSILPQVKIKELYNKAHHIGWTDDMLRVFFAEKFKIESFNQVTLTQAEHLNSIFNKGLLLPQALQISFKA